MPGALLRFMVAKAGWSPGTPLAGRRTAPTHLSRLLSDAFAGFSGEIDGFSAVAGVQALHATATVDVLDELDVWGGELDALLQSPLPAQTRSTLLAGQAYLEKVLERAGPTPQGAAGPDISQLRAVAREGRLEAGAIVTPPEKGVAWLEIEYLATAPWNLRGVQIEGYDNIRGAGSALVKLASMESHARGLGGRLLVLSDPGAVSFYEKLGFVAQGRGGAQTALLLDETGSKKLLTPSTSWR